MTTLPRRDRATVEERAARRKAKAIVDGTAPAWRGLAAAEKGHWRQVDRWRYGKLGRASKVRRIDPKTGKLIE